jgi:hypothetical protein
MDTVSDGKELSLFTCAQKEQLPSHHTELLTAVLRGHPQPEEFAELLPTAARAVPTRKRGSMHGTPAA